MAQYPCSGSTPTRPKRSGSAHSASCRGQRQRSTARRRSGSRWASTRSTRTACGQGPRYWGPPGQAHDRGYPRARPRRASRRRRNSSSARRFTRSRGSSSPPSRWRCRWRPCSSRCCGGASRWPRARTAYTRCYSEWTSGALLPRLVGHGPGHDERRPVGVEVFAHGLVHLGHRDGAVVVSVAGDLVRAQVVELHRREDVRYPGVGLEPQRGRRGRGGASPGGCR